MGGRVTLLSSTKLQNLRTELCPWDPGFPARATWDNYNTCNQGTFKNRAPIYMMQAF